MSFRKMTANAFFDFTIPSDKSLAQKLQGIAVVYKIRIWFIDVAKPGDSRIQPNLAKKLQRTKTLRSK